MRRFFLPPPAFQNDTAALPDGEAHHCLHVLRLKPGDKITVFDGRGHEAMALIEEIGDSGVTVRCLARSTSLPLACDITLAQAVPKGKNMELIVQKAVELGVGRISPLLSDRTVVHLAGEDMVRRQGKWQSVAIEACKQCGQNRIPDVDPPASIRNFLDSPTMPKNATCLPLIASLQPGAMHIKDALKAFREESGSSPSSAVMMIGPEGDFTPAEISAARGAGFRPVTLGPIILRTETAAMYSLSVLAHELF